MKENSNSREGIFLGKQTPTVEEKVRSSTVEEKVRSESFLLGEQTVSMEKVEFTFQ